MRSHWVLLIVVLTIFPLALLALGIGIAAAFGVAYLAKISLGYTIGIWPFWLVAFITFGLLFYAVLTLVKPDKMIVRFMRK